MRRYEHETSPRVSGLHAGTLAGQARPDQGRRLTVVPSTGRGTEVGGHGLDAPAPTALKDRKGLAPPLILLVPSRAAALELPRRLALEKGAVAGTMALTLGDLAHRLAEPHLLGRGVFPEPPGHGFLVALRLLEEGGAAALRLPVDAPTVPVALVLARTLRDLRRAEVGPSELRVLARRREGEDRRRIFALAALVAGNERALSGVSDEVARLRAAVRAVHSTSWLRGAEVLVVGDLEPHTLEVELLRALVTVTRARAVPSSLSPAFARELAEMGFSLVEDEEPPLSALRPALRPSGLQRIVKDLFETARGSDASDGSVEFLTAPGEAAEVRSLARRVLAQAAAGVAFDEMAILLPGVAPYVPLVVDLFARLGIPVRLWSPGPLRSGRVARSLELFLRCRGLDRRSILEFLSSAPIPFAELLGSESSPALSRWEFLSAEAGIVSGLAQWIAGLRGLAEAAEEGARQAEAEVAQRMLARARDAEALLRLVELLSGILDGLAGSAAWSEWSDQLTQVLDQWIGPETDRGAVVEVVRGLGMRHAPDAPVHWAAFEAALFARLDAAPLPAEQPKGGGVHVGTFDSLAGLTYRVILVPGLVEGGFPGVFRPDPLLLDDERSDLDADRADQSAPLAGYQGGRQLPLFPEAGPPGSRLPTTGDRLALARRLFRSALAQAREKLVLSYPRADARTGRERLPSLFYAAAASALVGHPLGASELACLVAEDDVRDLPPERCLDRSERDRARVWRGGAEALASIASGCGFFKRSRSAQRARLSPRLTEYDGLLQPLPPALAERLSPTTLGRPLSATRLATFSRCGFQYFLETIVGLDPVDVPMERLTLDPRDKGVVFHAVAERFLRELRDAGALPPKGTEAEKGRLGLLLEEELQRVAASNALRHEVLRGREKKLLTTMLDDWLAREVRRVGEGQPGHFEVSFGLNASRASAELQRAEPIHIPLGDGRTLDFAGRIDRIDVTKDGGLVLRDYKTGRAPAKVGDPDLRAALLVQLPLYVLAARQIFPDARVIAALCDYVADRGQIRRLDDVDASVLGFERRLRETVMAMSDGLFVQEPSACERCAFTLVCGPAGMVAARRERKGGDARVKRLARLGGGA